MTSRRVDGWGVIDPATPVPFTFDGGAFEGRDGDTLASALLANGVDVVAPSPVEGRPRGVFSAGIEEPNAFVELTAPWFEPIVPATMTDLVRGLAAHGRPGVGRLPLVAPPTRPADHRHAHVETLVVGGGTAGLEAATEAAAGGGRVLLANDRARWGGVLPDDAAATTAERIAGSEDVTLLPRTTALGLYDDGYVVLHERTLAIDRIWHVRARRVVLATGAVERPIAFRDGDRPGVMLAGAVRVYLERFGVLCGERAIVFTTNHWAYETARLLRNAGAQVLAIVDVAPGGSASDGARADGFEVLSGWAVARADGDRRVEGVVLVGPGDTERRLDADLIAVSGGWHPNTHLYRAIGGGLRYDDALAGWVPSGDAPPWLEVTGTATGDGLPASTSYAYTPADDLSRNYVDLQRDQTVADVIASVETGLRSVEHVKRRTYIGTAIDQGRTSAALTATIVNEALGEAFGAQGPTNVRPPAVPVSYAALAGRDRGALLDPVRTTPIHGWHVEQEAVFENVGQWKRPWYFPRDGEEMEAAVLRECRAVREAVGLLDASTLGKIDVSGRDAAAFLDRMYTNRMSTLPVGRIRYGLMLGLDGMVMDDGVAMRLADDRFLVTSTTGGAATVLDRFEEWLQTEWPDLRVSCTSVTEQWATVAVGGPRARDVVAAAGCDVDLSADAFPFLAWRDGAVAGVPTRIARVSFTGELSFELHVDGRHGAHVWEAVMEAGEPFGITPYGTEAMHVLRAEKGYVIVGQDTDGTVTPDDLGMSWIVRRDDSDFVGRRSLTRPDTSRPGRKQLVGLLPLDPDVRLAEGAQLLESEAAPAMLGHVTSSYRSAALGRTFALAMLRNGRSLVGSRVQAAGTAGTFACEVVAPVLWDPEDRRRDG